MRVLLFLAGLFPVSLFAQYDSVDFHNLDINYLCALVKLKVDSVRQSYGKPSLNLDIVLERAAEDQADYLRDRDKVSHYQTNYIKRDVMDRAHFYGASNIKKAGENVLWKYPRRLKKWDYSRNRYIPHFYYTYERLAKEIVEAWINSPKHFYVMMLPEFQYTGVGIAYDPQKVTITAVQVFGQYYR